MRSCGPLLRSFQQQDWEDYMSVEPKTWSFNSVITTLMRTTSISLIKTLESLHPSFHAIELVNYTSLMNFVCLNSWLNFVTGVLMKVSWTCVVNRSIALARCCIRKWRQKQRLNCINSMATLLLMDTRCSIPLVSVNVLPTGSFFTIPTKILESVKRPE